MAGNFNSDAAAFINQLRNEHAQNCGRIEDELYNEIVTGSPVQDGTYRANHNRSIGLPDFSYDLGKTHFPTPPPKIDPNNLVFFISNGLPYANRIEHGWSKMQAPKGVYGVAANSVKERNGG